MTMRLYASLSQVGDLLEVVSQHRTEIWQFQLKDTAIKDRLLRHKKKFANTADGPVEKLRERMEKIRHLETELQSIDQEQSKLRSTLAGAEADLITAISKLQLSLSTFNVSLGREMAQAKELPEEPKTSRKIATKATLPPLSHHATPRRRHGGKVRNASPRQGAKSRCGHQK
jgi:cell shape-determining protein MreC